MQYQVAQMTGLQHSSAQSGLHITPLSEREFDTYIEVGTNAYNQHYRHLWKDLDTTPYLENSFTKEVLQMALSDLNSELFLLYYEGIAVGILKIIKDSPAFPYSPKEALLLDKIYILDTYSGQGLGALVLDFVIARACDLNKKVVWLESMQNSPALHFYTKNGFEIYKESTHPFPAVFEDQRPMFILYKKV